MSLDKWNPETDPQPASQAGETEPRLPVAEAMEELLAELLSSDEAGGVPDRGAVAPGGPLEQDGADDWLEPAEDDGGPAAVAPCEPARWLTDMQPAAEAGSVEATAVPSEIDGPGGRLERAEPGTGEPEEPSAGSMEAATEEAAGNEPVATVEPGRPGDWLEAADGWSGVEAAATPVEPRGSEGWSEPETVPVSSTEPAIAEAAGNEPVATVEPGRPGDWLEAADGWSGVEVAATTVEPLRSEDWSEPEAALASSAEPAIEEAAAGEPVATVEPGRPGDWPEAGEAWPGALEPVVEATGVRAAARTRGEPAAVPAASVDQAFESAAAEADSATFEPGGPEVWPEAWEPAPVPEAAATEETAAAWPDGSLGLLEPTAAPALASEVLAPEEPAPSGEPGSVKSWLAKESLAGEWLEPMLEQTGAPEATADQAPSAPEPPLAAGAEEWLQPPGGDEWLESLLEQSAEAAGEGEPAAPAELAADDPWSGESGDALWEMPEQAATETAQELAAMAMGSGAWEPPGQADLPSAAALFVSKGEEAGAQEAPDAGEGAGAEVYPQAAPAGPSPEPVAEPVSVPAPPVPAGPSLEEVIADIDRTIEDAGRAVPDAAGEAQAPVRPERIKPGLEDYLVFSLSGADYALPIHEVTEIGRIPALTRVPNVPHFVRGITNLRGEVIAVLSLPVLLGHGEPPPSPRGRVLFVHLRERSLTTGLMVEDVKGIQRIPAQQLDPVPSFLDDKVTGVLRGVHGRGDRLLNVLHLGHLFELPEIRQLSAH